MFRACIALDSTEASVSCCTLLRNLEASLKMDELFRLILSYGPDSIVHADGATVRSFFVYSLLLIPSAPTSVLSVSSCLIQEVSIDLC